MDAQSRGFTLVEMLLVVVLLAIVAKTVVPSLNGNDLQRLDVAAHEVRDAMRFASAEAYRLNATIMLDAESTPGQIKLFNAPFGCSSFSLSALTDPRTKSAYVVNVTEGSFSKGVTLTARFLSGSGNAYSGLIYDVNGVPNDVCQITGTNSKGPPTAGSGVVLSLGGKQVTVALDVTSGRATLP